MAARFRSSFVFRPLRLRAGKDRNVWVLVAILCPLLVGCGLLFAGCTPLTAFNALTPIDRDVALAASNISYGPDPRHKLDVYVPSGGKDAAPVVVIVYGGSWNSGSKGDYAFLGKALASRGFVAVIADYRLVPAIRFPAFLDDGASAVVWAHANAATYRGDPKRLFLLGHSAGAYNAVMLALDGRYLEKLGSKTSIIKGVAALAGPYDFLPLDVASTVEAFGKTANLASTQPVNFVSQKAPAMLLATGSDDTTVRPRNTYALAEKLKVAGAPVSVRTYPGVGHVGILMAMSVPFRNKAPVLDDVATFVETTR